MAVVAEKSTQTSTGAQSGTVPATHEEIEAVSFATTAYDADRPPVPAGASLSDSLIGRRIDHFEIRAQLGQGGMGTVYLAHDVSLDRPVAIKVMRRDLGDKPDLVQRLVLEAQAQARLQHPHVVGVYYIGKFEGAPYFAMEYVRGETLAERLARRGPLPWQDALEYLIQITRALLEAHRRGFVHRDLKPSNLLVAEEGSGRAVGHVKIADFGLAAESGRVEEHLVGSPFYASPEQLAGKPPDHRSDIYSLGVTFHELISGSLPFEADSLGALYALHERAPRPPIPDGKAPWRLRRLITEMMDPAPTNRPWTYEELLERLEGLRPRVLVSGGVAARAMALAVDAGLATLLALVLAGLGAPVVAAGTAALAAWAAHYLAGHRIWGQTIGKRLFRLRIQGSTRAINLPGLALRFALTLWGPLAALTSLTARSDWSLAEAVGAPLAHLAAGRAGLEGLLLDTGVEIALVVVWLLGLFVAALDEHRRALHDLLGRTRVIYAMRAGEPERRRGLP